MAEKIIKRAKLSGLPNPISKGKKGPMEEKIDSAKFEDIRKGLETGDYNERTEIGARAVKEPDIVPILMRYLEDEKANVSADAALALGLAADKGANVFAALPALIKCLEEGSPRMRKAAAAALASATTNEKCRKPVLGALMENLKNGNWDVRRRAASALGYAAKRDASVAVPALAECLAGDENADVRRSVADALLNAAMKGTDVSAAVPALAKCLGDENADVRKLAAWALSNAAAEGGRDVLGPITLGINGFVQSARFAAECERNSRRYVEAANAAGNVLGALREHEEMVAKIEQMMRRDKDG